MSWLYELFSHYIFCRRRISKEEAKVQARDLLLKEIQQKQSDFKGIQVQHDNLKLKLQQLSLRYGCRDLYKHQDVMNLVMQVKQTLLQMEHLNSAINKDSNTFSTVDIAIKNNQYTNNSTTVYQLLLAGGMTEEQFEKDSKKDQRIKDKVEGGLSLYQLGREADYKIGMDNGIAGSSDSFMMRDEDILALFQSPLSAVSSSRGPTSSSSSLMLAVDTNPIQFQNNHPSINPIIDDESSFRELIAL